MVNAVLIAFLLMGCYTDIKQRRIPNVLSFGLIATGLAYNIGAGPGWLFSLTGILTGFVLFLLPFLFTGMGAGDVKLMMGVGAVLGWQETLYIGMLSSILAAVYVVVNYSLKGKLKELISFTSGQAKYILTKAQLNDYSREIIQGETIPYAVPIVIGTVIVMLWGWL